MHNETFAFVSARELTEEVTEPIIDFPKREGGASSLVSCCHSWNKLGSHKIVKTKVMKNLLTTQ